MYDQRVLKDLMFTIPFADITVAGVRDGIDLEKRYASFYESDKNVVFWAWLVGERKC